MVTPAAPDAKPQTDKPTLVTAPPKAAPLVVPKTPTPVNTLPSPNPSDKAVPEPPEIANQPPAVTPGMTREEKIRELCKQQFLRVQELDPGANFSHRGFCAKCGWQSYQHSADAAASIVTTHVLSHWKDVTRFL